MSHLTFTVTLRKKSTGYKVAAFLTEKLEVAHTFAVIIIRAPEYNRCFAVGTDWQNNEVFMVGQDPPQEHYLPREPAYHYPQLAPPAPVYRAIEVRQLPETESYGPPPQTPWRGR